MSVPAWAADIDGALAAFGLLDRCREARLISLSENATYLVELDDERMVARLHRPGFRGHDEILSELSWIDALREDDVVATPAVRRTPDGATIATFRNVAGEHQHAVIFAFAEGRNPDVSRPAALRGTFADLGEITARLHRHAASWSLPVGFTRPTWSVDKAIGDDADWAPWRSNPEVDRAAAQVLAAVETRVREDLASYGRLPGKIALLHGDLRATNLLVEGERTTVIDFDDCGFGWLLWDLACSLSFIEADPAVPHLVEAWLDGYSRHAVVDADDLAVLPALVMLRRLLLVGWMVSRVGTPEHGRMVGTYVPDSVRIGREYLAGSFLTRIGAPVRR